MFHFILRTIFPVLKLKDKNLSWGKKLYIYSEIFVMIWFIIWYILFIFMPILYEYKTINNKLSIYANTDINQSKISKILDQTNNILEKHHINQDMLDADIFLVNDDVFYYIGMLPFMQYFIYDTDAYTLINTVYFKQVNVNKNSVYANSNKAKPIPFTIVLSHELTHVWQNDEYGFIQNLMCEEWIKEGYAVYVSEELKALKGKKNFLLWIKVNNEEKITFHDKYILWGLMVKHAIEKMHKSVDDLHLGKVSYDEVYASLLKEYNITQSKQ